MNPKTGAPKEADPEGELEFYRFRLFVAGEEPNSLKAKAVLERLGNERLKGRFEIHVVDVFQDYQAAINHKVTIVPTLIIESPPPPKVIVGSLSDEEKVLQALGLFEKGEGV
jgi:circadian clock protein KaiB